ncbi:MAG: hypothetical protein ACXABD_15760 [Candidatus Thorarchaeota archaeon]
MAIRGEWKQLKFDGDEFKELGIDWLTGEACGVSMRILCDVNIDGLELLREFFGGAVPQHPGMNRGVNSIMLTRNTMRDLMIFAMLRNGADAVVEVEVTYGHEPRTEYRVFHGTNDQLIETMDFYRSKDWAEIGRLYTRSGTAHDGLANRHEFSGRVY